MEEQMRWRFYGLVGFGMVAMWSTVGLERAVLAAFVCVAVVNVPRVVVAMRSKPQPRRRSTSPRTRPLRDEGSYRDIVPDEPSLIVELG
jgi:hypothetical protein